MNFEEEITLLIKLRYPLVLVDTIDEEFVSCRLFEISRSLSMGFYPLVADHTRALAGTPTLPEQ